MRQRWMRAAWIALVVGWMSSLLLPKVYAVAVQGGEVGSGESGNAIKTYTLDSGSGGNAGGGGRNNIDAFGPGSLILGFKLIATSASANCDLYDTTSIAGKTRPQVQALVIDELAEVSANGTAIQIWPNPYRVVTGLSAGVVNGTCIVYYR